MIKTVKFLAFFSISSLFTIDVNAQFIFSSADNIPVKVNSKTLSNPWAGGINFPLWSSIDLNGDGLMDLYMYDRTNDRVLTFTNDGLQNSGAFHYAPQYVNKFPKVVQGGWGKCFDYNCDGKMDFYTVDSSGMGIALYRNDYSIAAGLQFTRVSEQLKESTSTIPALNIYASRILIPTFVDVDDDGDFDILGFNTIPNGRIAYHKNYAKENALPCDSFSFKFESQCWGNFALSLAANTVSTFHDPCPPPVAPVEDHSAAQRATNTDYNLLATDAPSYELAKRDDTITTIFAFDSDGDGLKDLLIGDIASSNSLLVHNAGTLQTADADTKDSIFPSYDIPVNIPDFVTHSFIDVDNDGKNDLIASAGQLKDKNGIWLYRNTGTNSIPVFNFQENNFLQGSMIDEGEAAAPVLLDYNADGLLDLIIAYGIYDTLPTPGVLSKLALYKNIGTASNPAFEFVTDDYAGISAYNAFNSFGNPIFPAFGDMDNDGDVDMIIGDVAGKLYYFNNSAGAGNAPDFQLTIPQYMNIDVGNNASPQIVDLNNDGLPDLVIGEKDGTVNYFQNTGTLSSAFFISNPATPPNIENLGNIDVRPPLFVNGYSVPYVFKYNNAHRILVSNMEGNIYSYDNIDGNLTGTFNQTDTLIRGSLGVRTTGVNLTVSGGDLNNDSLPDLLIGLFSGGMQIFYGTKTSEVADHQQNNFFECYPNPANDILTIRASGKDHSKYLFQIFNAVGIMVFEKQFAASSFSVDTKNLPSGFYYVQLSTTSGNQMACKKVIVYH